VAYENLDILLGRPTSIDPYDSVARVLRGRGGYCYHLNGAFSALLASLGYRVRWHLGGVQRVGEDPPGANGNYLALTVHSLPAPECPDGVWMVDVGFGDGPPEPLPLGPGSVRQGPFRYRIERSSAVAGGWRFTHDPAGWYALRGCRLTRVGATGRSGEDTHRAEEDIHRAGDWYAAIGDVFGLILDDLGRRERERLWRRVRAAHEAWLRRQPAAVGAAPRGAAVGAR
jgi:hypothetical protein